MGSTFHPLSRALLVLPGLLMSGQLQAQKLTRAESDFFESKVRPVFVDHCYKCHSQEAPRLKGGLSLETRAGWLKGGDTGRQP